MRVDGACTHREAEGAQSRLYLLQMNLRLTSCKLRKGLLQFREVFSVSPP